MYRLIEVSGKWLGRFQMAVPRDCKTETERDDTFIARLSTTPATEILVGRFEQAKFRGPDLVNKLENVVEEFFRVGVGSQVKTPHHVQYTQVSGKGGVTGVQGYSPISKDQIWIARALARPEWADWLYLVHWNGPEAYADSLIVPLLNSFDPVEEHG